jgi:hypothetical protein
MANLIIKSSANDLVIQGSDNSPAITVAAAGTTTFAENATLSGTANALGTVTAGNLSNTAIVYPVGHILQVVHHSSTAQFSTTTATGVTAASGAITTANATNKVLAIATAHISIAQASSGSSLYAGFSLECTSATTVNYGPKDGTGWYSVRANRVTDANADLGGYYTVQQLFEPDSQGAITVTMKVHGYPSQGHTVYVNQSSTHPGRSQLTLMEVAAI